MENVKQEACTVWSTGFGYNVTGPDGRVRRNYPTSRCLTMLDVEKQRQRAQRHADRLNAFIAKLTPSPTL